MPAPLLMTLRKLLPEAWLLALIRRRYGIRRSAGNLRWAAAGWWPPFPSPSPSPG